MTTDLTQTWSRFLQTAIFLCFFTLIATGASAQWAAENDPKAKEITTAMDKAAEDWNKGNLDAYIGFYDPSATMMMKTAPAGMEGIRGLYEKSYFKDGMPKQNLRYTNMKVRFLGKKFALLTGGFTLYGNNLSERSGVYSLVLEYTKAGWKILHDHSS